MRLGLTLFKYKCTIPHRFRGKYRIVKDPSLKDLYRMRQDFDREEQNMLILRHPYLTIEQSFGHAQALRDNTQVFLDKYREEKRQKFYKEISFADHLCHVGYGEKWD
ncbi:PREDICTED: uncharacterized protein LOC106750289 [Dinoponera quadriceps]|uniref:Uncharacterized protein LOC106750289 n=1 Tax=Dinoponera quadriceps TaxID=609295 RepID=A0A6P3Y566_DINQU|nr:PREDICTED: uncharacterized protein LOC106750289 [Dinoponera quadriceps]